MRDRIVILSDLHLGKHPHRVTARMLRGVWRPGEHLVVNGDVAELHDPRYASAASEEVLALQGLCEAEGVSLTLIAGNHDPSIAPRRHLFLGGGEVLVTHGDAVHPDIAPWCHTAPIYRAAYAGAIDSLPHERREQLESRLWAATRAAELKWQRIAERVHHMDAWRLLLRPWAVGVILHYWHVFPRHAADFARRFAAQARFVIVGHSHRQGVWHVDGRTVINTGSYSFPGRPRAVIVEGRSLGVVDVIRGRDGWRLDDRPVARFELEKPAGVPLLHDRAA